MKKRCLDEETTSTLLRASIHLQVETQCSRTAN